MQGRALDRDRRRDWAWMLPFIGMLLSQGAAALTGADRAAYLFGGLLVGAAWQLLHRRDLADRLVFPVVLTLVALGFAVVRGEPIELAEDTAGPEAVLLYVAGILAALVLTEQQLRHRERRALSAGAPARSRGSARP